MYKDGIRWTESMEPFGIDTTYHYMVLDIYLYDHPFGFQDTYHDHPVTCDNNHHISEAWSHELQKECPAGKKPEHE